MSNIDDIIDPDANIEALAEAMGRTIQEEVTILTLLNQARVKVRYMPQSIGSSLEFDNGTPIAPGTRKPKFQFNKWAREVLPKLNALALKNVQIINDLDGKAEMPKNGIRLSLISPGEFRRLQELCFPGAVDDSPDSEDEDNAPRGKSGKRVRGKDAPAIGE
jgi:hypothetical protein